MRWGILAAATLLAGCASTEIASALSVPQLQSRQRQLHGQVVLVRGYLMGCRPSWCRLSASPGEPGQLPKGAESLSIQSNDAFDAAASMISPAEIILKARVDGSGLPDPVTRAIVVRTDCCDLEAIEIVRVVREIDGKFQ